MAATEQPAASAAVSVEELRAREKASAPRAAFLAALAGALAVFGGVIPQTIYSDFPRVFTIDALRDAAGQPIGRAGLRTAQVLFYDDHALSLLLVAVSQAMVALAIAQLLLFLAGAADARGATVPRVARPLVRFGSIAVALGTVGLQIAVQVRAHDFAGSSDHSTAAAHDVLGAPAISAGSLIGGVGNLALAAGFVLIVLAAMRVGLLTRFLGVLGAIVGALMVLGPLSGSPVFIVQALWLFMVAALVVGRLPSGLPPAWERGEAVPWPTQQEAREERERRRGGEPAKPAVEAASDPAAVASPAASKKKKRKRRT